MPMAFLIQSYLTGIEQNIIVFFNFFFIYIIHLLKCTILYLIKSFIKKKIIIDSIICQLVVFTSEYKNRYILKLK